MNSTHPSHLPVGLTLVLIVTYGILPIAHIVYDWKYAFGIIFVVTVF